MKPNYSDNESFIWNGGAEPFEVGRVYSWKDIDRMGFTHPSNWTPASNWTRVSLEDYVTEAETLVTGRFL